MHEIPYYTFNPPTTFELKIYINYLNIRKNGQKRKRTGGSTR